MIKKIVIVNEKDEVICAKTREEASDDEIHRVTGLWVFNSKGEVLLAQRKFNKRYDPGKWGPSCAGTVEEGESYEENIRREAKEELGIDGFDLIKGPKHLAQSNHRYFRQMYKTYLDKDISEFKIADDEVEAIKWISLNDLIADIKSHPENYTRSLGSDGHHLEFLKASMRDLDG